MEAMMSNLVIESRQSVVAKPKWAVSILNPSEPSSGEIAPIVSGQYFFVVTQRGGIFLMGHGSWRTVIILRRFKYCRSLRAS
jgi:hypothetical protein